MTSSSSIITSIPILLVAVILTTTTHAAKLSSSPMTTSSSGNTKPLQFTSPIQSYTIFDKAELSTSGVTPRRKFLPRFRAGLIAERRAKEVLMDEQRRGIVGYDDDEDDIDGGSWAEASAAADERKKKAMDKRVEVAHDTAVSSYDARVAAKKSSPSTSATSNSKYQFVGLVNDGKDNKKGNNNNAVQWYARKKPKNSKWNVRLVHVNRDAVLRELFVKGKVDVYGKYINEGIDKAAFEAAETSGEDTDQQPGMKPLVKAQYTVKERSWKTLWNFSPKRMFTTSSGSFWRERRINPGLYTDGNTVYESVYRYRDGKNGLKPVAKLSNFLSSPGMTGVEEKLKVVERLNGGDDPDIVIEK